MLQNVAFGRLIANCPLLHSFHHQRTGLLVKLFKGMHAAVPTTIPPPPDWPVRIQFAWESCVTKTAALEVLKLPPKSSLSRATSMEAIQL